MNKISSNKKGFSAIEATLVIVIVIMIGAIGWLVYNNRDKTKKVPVAATAATSIYSGWKTYHSILGSDLSFKYPSNWVFTPATEPATPNSLGGVENLSRLYSVAPKTVLGEYSATATNQFMCVSFDEYKEKGYQPGNNFNGWPIVSQEARVNNTNLTLVTYHGATPMQDVMVLYNPKDTTSNGGQIINTQNGYSVIVSAEFNCGQAGFPPNANLNADFNTQPETATAKLIMKSIQF